LLGKNYYAVTGFICQRRGYATNLRPWCRQNPDRQKNDEGAINGRLNKKNQYGEDNTCKMEKSA